MGIEQLHYDHLDAFIFASMTWEEYRSTPATFHASKPTWWRRKRALIAQGKPVKMDSELIKENKSKAKEHSQGALPLIANGDDFEDTWDTWDSRNIWYVTRILNETKVLPSALFPDVTPQTIDLTDVGERIGILPIFDRNLVQWATDLTYLVQTTKAIMQTPGLYLCILGDAQNLLSRLRQNFMRYNRDRSRYSENVLLDTWLSWIAPRVLFATSRHLTLDRGNAENGYIELADNAKWRAITCDLFGRVNIRVGSEEYQLGISKALRGYTLRSSLHRTMGALKHATDGPELILLESTRSTGALSYSDGDLARMIVACGKDLELRRGVMGFPCFTLDGSKHDFVTFPSVRSWVEASSRG